MKMVRTRLGYEEVVLHDPREEGATLTLTREAVKVSNKVADELIQAAAMAGVELKVVDIGEDEPEDPTDSVGGVPSTVEPVDLSAGVAAVTGTGEPVTSEQANGDPSLVATDDDKQTGAAGNRKGK